MANTGANNKHVCPACKRAVATRVKDSRQGSIVTDNMETFGQRRRRLCECCGHRWTTYELREDTVKLIMTRSFDIVADTLVSLMQDDNFRRTHLVKAVEFRVDKTPGGIDGTEE